MKSSRWVLAAVAVATAAVARPAYAFGVGIEAGGAATYASNAPGSSTAGSANLGLILEEQFDLSLIFLDLWGDGQTPIRLQTGAPNAAQYIPIDLGLRLGLKFGVVQPYIGVLGQLLINIDDGGPGAPPLNTAVFGLGADLGIDFAFWICRVGLELRGATTVTQLASNGPAACMSSSCGYLASTGGIEAQALASFRFAF